MASPAGAAPWLAGGVAGAAASAPLGSPAAAVVSDGVAADAAAAGLAAGEAAGLLAGEAEDGAAAGVTVAGPAADWTPAGATAAGATGDGAAGAGVAEAAGPADCSSCNVTWQVCAPTPCKAKPPVASDAMAGAPNAAKPSKPTPDASKALVIRISVCPFDQRRWAKTEAARKPTARAFGPGCPDVSGSPCCWWRCCRRRWRRVSCRQRGPSCPW
jgi:hypothetical protein